MVDRCCAVTLASTRRDVIEHGVGGVQVSGGMEIRHGNIWFRSRAETRLLDAVEHSRTATDIELELTGAQVLIMAWCLNKTIR